MLFVGTCSWRLSGLTVPIVGLSIMWSVMATDVPAIAFSNIHGEQKETTSTDCEQVGTYFIRTY